MLGSDGREAKMFRKGTGRDGRNVEVMSKIGRYGVALEEEYMAQEVN